MMKIFRTASRQVLVQFETEWFELPLPDWDAWFCQDQLFQKTLDMLATAIKCEGPHDPGKLDLLPPIGSQELWACGVTYMRSRSARMEESQSSGGGDFYDKVYDADRPEIFFKSTADRVRGPCAALRTRQDSTWDVPEPELTLALSATGQINGYTIGNDMSSRSIEGENPLYLPQAKTYDGCASLGPCLFLTPKPLPQGTAIAMTIERQGVVVFQGETSIDHMKRSLVELVGWLFRELSFARGVYLMTGTGIVPDSNFTLEPGDEVRIHIDPIGCLMNRVER
jgi:2-dehydro-3-deoxy-D-arabinonate dehydratase